MISADQLTISNESKTMVAELSDLQGAQQWGMLMSTLMVRSPKTGNIAIFVHSRTVRDADYDTMNWVYESKALPGWRLIIYND